MFQHRGCDSEVTLLMDLVPAVGLSVVLILPTEVADILTHCQFGALVWDDLLLQTLTSGVSLYRAALGSSSQVGERKTKVLIFSPPSLDQETFTCD